MSWASAGRFRAVLRRVKRSYEPPSPRAEPSEAIPGSLRWVGRAWLLGGRSSSGGDDDPGGVLPLIIIAMIMMMIIMVLIMMMLLVFSMVMVIVLVLLYREGRAEEHDRSIVTQPGGAKKRVGKRNTEKERTRIERNER